MHIIDPNTLRRFVRVYIWTSGRQRVDCIWGKRFTTSVAAVRSTAAEVLKERYASNDVQVVRSVKRRDGKTRWWFTVMAPP